MKSRVIPVLGLNDGGLYKTKGFQRPIYVGDPVNAVKVFNEKSVHELMVCGFRCSIEGKGPEWSILRDIANEAFMPLAYGGGIRNMTDVRYLVKMGYEKICFSSAVYTNPNLIKDAIQSIGASSVMVSLDYVAHSGGRMVCRGKSGTLGENKYDLLETMQMVQSWGVGEVILHSIERDGGYTGFDFDTYDELKRHLRVPAIILGGASSYENLKEAKMRGIQGVAASSLFVFYGKLKAVLINYSEEEEYESGM